jgi:hypothetical protein
MTQHKPKPLSHQFEDELGAMVDRYLSEGIDIESLKQVLRYEADFDHEERRRDLQRPTSPLTSKDSQ